MARSRSDSVEELTVSWYSGKIPVSEGIDHFHKCAESGDPTE